MIAGLLAGVERDDGTTAGGRGAGTISVISTEETKESVKRNMRDREVAYHRHPTQ